MYPKSMTHLTLTDERVLALLEQLTTQTGQSAESVVMLALENLTALQARAQSPSDEIDVAKKAAEILAWLEKDVWSHLPEGVRGHAPG